MDGHDIYKNKVEGQMSSVLHFVHHKSWHIIQMINVFIVRLKR